MRIPIRLVSFCFALIALVACTSEPTPVVVIPTLASLPTATLTPIPSETFTSTPTDTPSNTPLPTETALPTETNTPPNTATPQATVTASLTNTTIPTVTASFTPTASFTASATLRPTLTNTPLPTNTPRATSTPRPTLTNTLPPTNPPTATLPAPVIRSFISSAGSVTPNTTVLFTWDAEGESAVLDQINSAGVVTQQFPVPVSGQFTIAVPSTLGRTAQYRLTVRRAGLSEVRSLQLLILCTTQWFFGDQFAPPTAGCPAAPATSGDGRYQSFERGQMIYSNATGQNRILGMLNANFQYIGIGNGWDGTTLDTTAAPGGLFIPQQMFNWAYYRTLAPVGTTWNSALGWATGDIIGEARTIQFEGGVGGSNPFYIDAPGGAVFRFSGSDSGTWQRIR